MPLAKQKKLLLSLVDSAIKLAPAAPDSCSHKAAWFEAHVHLERAMKYVQKQSRDPVRLVNARKGVRVWESRKECHRQAAIQAGSLVELRIPETFARYTVENNPKTLEAFNVAVEKRFPSKPLPRPTPGRTRKAAFHSQPAARAPRYPSGGTPCIIEGGGWSSNGNLLLKGEVPMFPPEDDRDAKPVSKETVVRLFARLTGRMGVDRTEFFCLEDGMVGVSDVPMPASAAVSPSCRVVRLTGAGGKAVACIPQDQYLFAKKWFPSACFALAYIGDTPVVLLFDMPEDALVGIIMPYDERAFATKEMFQRIEEVDSLRKEEMNDDDAGNASGADA